MNNEAHGVKRILYKEIKQGDLRKIKRESNDSPTGGGARDFRFGSYKKLESVIKKMFPNTVKQMRNRSGKVEIDIFQGEFSWKVGDDILTQESFFEPPTDARPQEGRITRVPEYACFDTKLIPEGGPNDRVLLLIVQLNNESVWPFFATEQSLRIDPWDYGVQKQILKCLNSDRPQTRAVIGYYDFTTQEGYCDGKGYCDDK